MTNYGLLALKKCFALIGSSRIKEIAYETKFIQRERQLNSTNFFSFLVRNHTHLVTASLDDLCLDFGAHNVLLTKAALNKKFSQSCVDFVQKILEELLVFQIQTKIVNISILKNMPFLRVLILDGTGFNLPKRYEDLFMGYKQAGIKIQYEFDYLSAQTLLIKTEDGKASDSPTGFERLEHVRPKDLCIQDLGYYNTRMFEQIRGQGAYFLSRAPLDSQFFLEVENPPRRSDGSYIEKYRYNRIYIKDEMEKLERGSYKEWDLIYVGSDKKTPVRCVIYRHTEKQEKEHQKRMERKRNKSKKKLPKQEVLDLAGMSIYLTNLPLKVSKEEITQLYRLRWQIELLFKTWKSHLKLVQVKSVKIERWLCHFYTQCIVLVLSLLAMAVMRKIIWTQDRKPISEDLLIRFFSKKINQLSKASQESLYKWRSIWKDFIPIIKKSRLKTTDKEYWTLFS